MNVGSSRATHAERPAHQFRILHCLRAPAGGLFRHVCDLTAELARRGHLVGAVCAAGTTDQPTARRLERLEQHLALGLHRLPMSRHLGIADFAACRGIRRLVEALDIEVIHGHGAKGGAYARLVAHSRKRAGFGIACLYTPHGGSLHYHPRSGAGRLYMALERTLAHTTDAVIFESAYAAARYAAQVGAVTCTVCTIPNGLHAEDFEPLAPSAAAADFLFVGELRHLKGVDVMLEALARVQAVRPIRAIVVGEGPDAAAFKALASRLGLAEAVSFVGALPAAEAFRLGRALIVPSRAESFPYVVLEAAAAGLPMLATAVGGIPEIVAATDTRLVAAEDVEGLADAMLNVLADPEAACKRAQRLRECVAGRLTVGGMTDRILDLYATFAASA
jgi:glycosyltransferase involved in cell wall biosynthesis